jgi:hypothetical protein
MMGGGGTGRLALSHPFLYIHYMYIHSTDYSREIEVYRLQSIYLSLQTKVYRPLSTGYGGQSKWQYTDYGLQTKSLQFTDYKLQFTVYRLPSIDYNLHTTAYRLQTKGDSLQTTVYRKKSTDDSLHTTDHRLQTADCRLKLQTIDYYLCTVFCSKLGKL